MRLHTLSSPAYALTVTPCSTLDKWFRLGDNASSTDDVHGDEDDDVAIDEVPTAKELGPCSRVCPRLRASGLGIRVQGARYRVHWKRSGGRVLGVEFRVSELGFRVVGSRVKVSDLWIFE